LENDIIINDLTALACREDVETLLLNATVAKLNGVAERMRAR
jgi:hypothetical protein